MSLALLLAPLARPGDPPESERVRVRREGDAYRLALEYAWDRDGPVLPWIMLNPALAGTAAVYDRTARRVIRWSWRWGFGGALLLNAAPVVAPRTADLRAWLAWSDRGDVAVRDALWRNQAALQGELATHEAAIVAWGTAPLSWPAPEAYAFDQLLEQTFDAINDPDGPRNAVLQTFCLGLTQGSRPLHPMARGRHRVPDDARPIPFPNHPGTIRSLGQAA